MAKPLTTEEFTFKANLLHNNRYTYNKTVYINNTSPIVITCKEHGDFNMIPAVHLRGSNCQKCAAVTRDHAKKLDTASFITKASIAHNNKYNYNKTVFTTSKTKVIITCPYHGDFEQTPNNHLSKYGCKECARLSTTEKQTKTTEEFIQAATKIHGTAYDYSLVQYQNTKTPVTILCEQHGTFSMSPSNHTHKTNPQGCPTCGRISVMHKTGWTTSEWEAAGVHSSNFTGFKLYIVKCWNSTESFIKIGKTFRNISDRFKNKVTMPYNWELLHTKEGSAEYIRDLEKVFHSKLKPNKYLPNIAFGGQFECFTNTSISDIQDILNEL